MGVSGVEEFGKAACCSAGSEPFMATSRLGCQDPSPAKPSSPSVATAFLFPVARPSSAVAPVRDWADWGNWEWENLHCQTPGAPGRVRHRR